MNTTREYSFLDAAFDFYNAALFDGELPQVVITLVNKPGSKGYYHFGRFAHRQEKTAIDEISLNPDVAATRTDEQTLSTLAHEMCHLYQYRVKPGKLGYHDKVWSEKMESIGLMPSTTGEPGGKKTGQQCTHYIIPGGRFETVTAQFLAQYGGLTIEGHAEYLRGYTSIPTGSPAATSGSSSSPKAEKKTSKQKYTCPTCGLNAWAKPAARLTCTDCQKPMEEQTA